MQVTVPKPQVLAFCIEHIKTWTTENYKSGKWASKKDEKFPDQCKYGDITASKADIDPLICPKLSELITKNERPPEIQKQDKPLEKSQSPNEKLQSPNERGLNKSATSSPKSKLNPLLYEGFNPSKYGIKLKWDPIYDEILKHIIDLCHRNEIIRRLGKSLGMGQYRLKRLIECKIITPTPQNIGGWACVTYAINPPFDKVFIYDEKHYEKHEPALQFYKHANALKTKIPDKTIPRPKGNRSYHPRNWKAPAQIFKYPTHTIRLMDNYAVVDINIRLSADSFEALQEKYKKLAASYFHAFSEKYKYPLSEEIEEYRHPHTSIKGSKGIADAIVVKGEELYVPGLGIQVDHSHDGGEVEFVGAAGARSAIILEQAINHFPKIAAGVKSDNLQTRKIVKTMSEKIDGIEAALRSEAQQIQKISDKTDALALVINQQREIQLLKEENQLFKASHLQIEKQTPKEKSKPGVEFQ